MRLVCALCERTEKRTYHVEITMWELYYTYEWRRLIPGIRFFPLHLFFGSTGKEYSLSVRTTAQFVIRRRRHHIVMYMKMYMTHQDRSPVKGVYPPIIHRTGRSQPPRPRLEHSNTQPDMRYGGVGVFWMPVYRSPLLNIAT
jgi:hypothetical protein